ncbi:hypothetical protein ABTX77_36440 [Streptomyces sp. NPDC097704]|uniref:hypothetical protein n=1 Tax=Streptomyces sp. NPDC097704 TaxID=3157101 RepID=UPI00331D42B5
MHDVWKYFEGKPEFLTAVAAVIAIVGAIVGAKIQANSGRAQAAAAREAAEIAAEAQRVAALWTVRQGQLAEFVRSARKLRNLCEQLWSVDDETLGDAVSSASEEMSLLWAEVQLTGTEAVVKASGEFASAALEVEAAAHEYAPALHARAALRRITANNDDLGAEVQRILEMTESSFEYQIERLCDTVPTFSREQAAHVVINGRLNSDVFYEERNLVGRAFNEALRVLVRESRVMLRSDSDVVPTVPTQRRWWQRAA